MATIINMSLDKQSEDWFNIQGANATGEVLLSINMSPKPTERVIASASVSSQPVSQSDVMIRLDPKKFITRPPIYQVF